jgi:hypothetical protein
MKQLEIKSRLTRTAMILALMLTATTAWAEDVNNVSYYDPTDAVNPTKTVTNPTAITGETTAIGTTGQTTWYYVSGNVTCSSRIEVLGTVNIILADGCKFTASKGIEVYGYESANALNIWAQSTGDGCGRLSASRENYDAAIGGNGGPENYGLGVDGNPAGIITIYGGNIYANGNIGGGNGGVGFSYDNYPDTGGNGGSGTIVIHDGYINIYEGNLGGGNGGYGQGVIVSETEQYEYDDNNEIINSWTEYTYEGGTGGNGGAGTVTINGGYVNVRGNMGGGYYGTGDSTGGNYGTGTVSLSWSKVSDMIVAQGYRGTVRLQKSFMDENENVYEGDYVNGMRDDASINNTWLYPYGTMYGITIGGSYDPACLESSKAKAMEGVVITLTAVNGYKVSSVTVKDADNQDVSLTDNQNGTWTFIMPAKAVTVTPVATRYYQASSSNNISYDVADASDKMVQKGKTYYRPGATINFSVTVPDGYVIQSLTVKDADDQDVSYTDNGNYSYTFTMPAKDVTMEAVTVRDFTGLTLIEGTAAFTVTAGTDDVYAYGYGHENLLDGKYSSTDARNYSKWYVEDVTLGCYVEFNTAAPVIPKHYTLISSDSPWESQGCYPTTWTIQAKASADDEWTTIAAENNNYKMNDNQACHSYIFDFNNPGNNAYQYFRFEVTEVEGWQELGDEWNPSTTHKWLELSEMQMYVKPAERLTMNSAGIMTYASTQALDFSNVNGLTAYIVSDFSGSKLTLSTVDMVPAGTGLLLKGTPSTTFTIPVATNASAPSQNYLHGVTDATTVVYQTEDNGGVDYTNFILANGSYGIDWYTLSEAGAIGANKAYLSLPTASLSNASGFQWVYEGETTSLTPALSKGEGAWYTLDGRKLTQQPTQKGIYINNGRKIMVK